MLCFLGMEQYASMSLQVVVKKEEQDDGALSTATYNPVVTQWQPCVKEEAVQPITEQPEPTDDDVDTEVQGMHMLASPWSQESKCLKIYIL